MVQFVFTSQCCAKAIIDFVEAQAFLTEQSRARVAGEILLDYLMWAGEGCCIREFQIEREVR